MAVFVVTATLGAILAIIAGLIVLIFPRTLNYAVGIYLILIGLLFFLGQLGF